MLDGYARRSIDAIFKRLGEIEAQIKQIVVRLAFVERQICAITNRGKVKNKKEVDHWT